MLSEETAIQQNNGVDMLPAGLDLLITSILCLSGAKSSANTPGNAVLCEPIDLQSEHQPQMLQFLETFYIYIYTLNVFKILHPIILILDCKFLVDSSH